MDNEYLLFPDETTIPSWSRYPKPTKKDPFSPPPEIAALTPLTGAAFLYIKSCQSLSIANSDEGIEEPLPFKSLK